MGSGVARTSGVLVAVLLALSPVLVACGGDEEPEAEPTPSESTTSATSSPSPTKTEEPLSEFEDEAPVKAVRKWAAVVGKAVNQGDTSMRSTRVWATPSGVAIAAQATAGDLESGYRWPGPQPFTPVAVRTRGKSATLNVCFQTYGWARNENGKRVNKRKVEPAVMEMKRMNGRWKVSNVDIGGPFSCSDVSVKGVRW